MPKRRSFERENRNLAKVAGQLAGLDFDGGRHRRGAVRFIFTVSADFDEVITGVNIQSSHGPQEPPALR